MPINTVYDEEVEKNLPNDALSKDELQAQEAVENTPDTQSNGSESGSESAGLKNAETAAGGDASLYNPEGEGGGRFGKLRGRLGAVSQNKLLVGGAAGGIGGVIILVVLLTLAVGPFKIVALAEQMSAYQFARVTREAAKNAEVVTSEKMGIDVADESLFGKIKAKYATGTGKTKTLWEKFDKYRPNKTISNFENSGKLSFNYKTSSILQRPQLYSATIEGTEVKLIRGTAKNLIPGYNFVSGAKASQKFAPTLIESLKASDIGPLTRAKIARQARQELRISLTAWVLGKYLAKPGATPEEVTKAAYAAEEQLAFDLGAGFSSGTDAAVIEGASKLNDTANKAKAAEAADVHSPTGIQAIVDDPNQLTLGYEEVLNSEIKSSALLSAQGALKAINPFYAVAVPLCLVYDGSTEKAGPTINAQTAQVQRNALQTQIEAAQQKDGSNVSAAAVEAANWKHGDTTKSNAYQRAAGNRVDTSNYPSVEASPYGQYSRSLADLVPSPLDAVIHSLGDKCSLITNLWVGLGLGAVNVALLVSSGGSSGAVEGATEGGIDLAVSEVVPSLASRVISKLIAGGNFTKEFGLTVGKQIIAIEGATLLSKQLILSQTGTAHSSLAVGKTYSDDNDSGLNIHAGVLEQRQHYGVALADSELQSDNAASRTFLAYKESQKSPFDRYLAFSNPNSLVTHLGIMASARLNISTFSSLFSSAGRLLNPVRSGGSLLDSIFSGTSFAATPITSANTYYGNVQFGYTAEETLLKSTDSYKPFANQQILDDSGQEDLIQSRYGMCFDGSKSIGTMLQDGDIERDKNGSVLTEKGKCSQSNLGPHSKDFRDLVFRWRVAKAYENTIDQLNDEQDLVN